MIRMFKPTVTPAHVNAVTYAMYNEKFVDGESTEKFRDLLRIKFDRSYCSLCNSGTSALILAMRAAQERGYVRRKSDVHTTPLSFISTSSAIRLAGLEPVFHDVDEDGLVKFREELLPKDKLIVPVALYGKKFPYHYENVTIEDDAQAHGMHNTDVLANCFSFYTTKNLTVGGYGGAIMTDDEKLHKVVESLINNGRVEGYNYKHQYISSSYRINNINAAFGLVTLKMYEKLVSKRIVLANTYNTMLNDIDNITIPSIKDHVFHLYVIRVPEIIRDELREFLLKWMIQTSIQYPILIPDQEPFKQNLCYDIPNARKFVKQIISLPLHPELNINDVEYVSNAIRIYLGYGEL